MDEHSVQDTVCMSLVQNNHISSDALALWIVALSLVIVNSALARHRWTRTATFAVTVLAHPVVHSGYFWTGRHTADTDPGAFVFTGVLLAVTGAVIVVDHVTRLRVGPALRMPTASRLRQHAPAE